MRLIIPEKAIAFRKLIDTTQQELADSCGVTKQTISNFETKYNMMNNRSLLRNRILYSFALKRVSSREYSSCKMWNKYWHEFSEIIE